MVSNRGYVWSTLRIESMNCRIVDNQSVSSMEILTLHCYEFVVQNRLRAQRTQNHMTITAI
jgi:hypothetical protein